MKRLGAAGLATCVAVTGLAGATPGWAAGDAKRGEPMYQRYCSGCHGADGHGGAKNFMPHVGALTRKGYIELLEDDYLAMVIAEGGEAVGKSAYMPSWKTTLSQQDIADIIAYVRTLSVD
jgi:mono/diheme cytochrome c family protein